MPLSTTITVDDTTTILVDVAQGIQGATGAPGPAPSGTGLVSVTSGVLDTPSTLSARVAADAANLRTQLGLGDAATKNSSEGGNIATDPGKLVSFLPNGWIKATGKIQIAGDDGTVIAEYSEDGATFTNPSTGFALTINGSPSGLTGNKAVSFQDASGTIALLEGNQTFTGALSFSSTTRPTSAGTGTPAATSLITKTDGEALFLPIGPQAAWTALNAMQVKTFASTSTAANNTTPVDISGGGSITLAADTWYKVEVPYRITTGDTTGIFIILATDGTFTAGTTLGVAGVGSNGSATVARVYVLDSTNIYFNAGTNAVVTNCNQFATFYFQTGTAGTAKFRVAKGAAGTVAHTVTGGVAVITKLDPTA